MAKWTKNALKGGILAAATVGAYAITKDKTAAKAAGTDAAAKAWVAAPWAAGIGTGALGAIFLFGGKGKKGKKGGGSAE